MIDRRSSWFVPVLITGAIAATPAAAAPPITAEEAMTNYQKSFGKSAGIDCRRDSGSDEIVVCGRSEQRDPNRVPLPDEREPGAPVRLLPGEPPSAVPALSAGDALSCSTVGRNPRCNGGLDVFRVVGVLGKAIKALRSRD